MILKADDFGAQTDVPELIPARMLNAFCYCPRLGYLEWVQGEFEDNLDTMEGTFGHRRVDAGDAKEIPAPDVIRSDAADTTPEAPRSKPSLAPDEAKPENFIDPAVRIHARSVMLSAEREGLLARIDLLEVDGMKATPVDYKRGSIPDVPERAWEPERVQLCVQGLILRENGFESTEGVIYYIESNRRIIVPFDDALIERTRALRDEFRAVAAGRMIPPPLVDSPKCPRCSLVGICLPDETQFLSVGLLDGDTEEASEDEPATEKPGRIGEVRRLAPARDDAVPLYVNEQGAMLGKSGERLEVKKSGKSIQSARMLDVSQVSLFGNVQVTSQALRELAARGVPICYFSYGGWFYAMTNGLVSKNIELRIRQFEIAADPIQSLELAKAFIDGKIRNCRTLLRRNIESDPENALAQLSDLAARVRRCDSAASLLGIEGTAARIYFSAFSRLLNDAAGFRFENRNRRPPTDPVNAILSFVYALLTKDLTIAVQSVGLDPMLGMYHRPRFGRPSMALDLAEEFRPLIADSVVVSLINSREVGPDGFIRRANAVALTPAARRAVIGAYERRMDQLVTHPIFGYRLGYRRLLHVQARLLTRVLLGELAEYPSFQTR